MEDEIIEPDEYGKHLNKFGISYRIETPWIVVGNIEEDKKWILYVSCFGNNMPKLIEKVAPYLFLSNTPFKILQNSSFISKANGLWFGMHMASKVMIIIPENELKLRQSIKEINRLTANYKGPNVLYVQQLGPVLYTNYCIMEKITRDGLDTLLNKYYLPNKKPFHIPKQFRQKRRKSIIGKYYVPLKTLVANPKGDILLGVNMKRFSFTHCLIKQAKGVSFIDNYGRSSFHKLLWQKVVIEALQDHIPTPRIIDFCKTKDDYYLILEYIDGVNLNEEIKRIFKGKTWTTLSLDKRRILLSLFERALTIINIIHNKGYVHRDITSKNFIFDKSGKLFIIDFELAYSLTSKVPNPVFKLGTEGFVSPEQLESQNPEIAQDVYSMGALLLFIITGEHPLKLTASGLQNTQDVLHQLDIHPSLIKAVISCLNPDPVLRPTISELQETIVSILRDSEPIRYPSQSIKPQLEVKYSEL